MTRRRFLSVASLAGGAALLAACAPAAPSQPAAVSTPAAKTGAVTIPTPALPAAQATAQPAPTPAQAAPAVAVAGKLIIMTGAEPAQFDLQLDSSTAARNIAFDNVMEGLVSYDDDMRMMPGLASSWEQMESTRMRFKLRQGISFHNGERFTSAAVVTAVQRLNDPNLKSFVLGFVDTIKEAVPVDDYTVDIVTNGPDPILLRRMTFLAMIAPDYLAKNPNAAIDKPIGTGPYEFTEWTKGQRILLTANEKYWGDRKPTIKEAEFLARKEPSVRLTALKTGEAHLIENVSPEAADSLPKEQIATQFATECMILRPNCKGGVTADKRVRQAMSMALDREAIVSQIMGNFAQVPNGQLFIPSTFGYDPEMRDLPFDLEKAKTLVKEAGAEGKEVSIVGPSSNRWMKDREIQEAFTAMINKTGLKVDLRMVEQAEWNRAGRELENPPMDVWFTSSGNDLLDPDRIFSAYLKTGGRNSMHTNPELDKLIDAERAELDPEKRGAILRQISKYNRDEGVVIPIAQQNWVYGVSPKVTFKPMPNAQIILNRMTFKP